MSHRLGWALPRRERSKPTATVAWSQPGDFFGDSDGGSSEAITQRGSIVANHKIMEYVNLEKIASTLSGMLAQSDAAALAVLVAHVRANSDELARERRGAPIDLVEEDQRQMVCAFLQELEAIAVNSIRCNDGNVVHWIGVAAKQMNPLLS